MSWGHAIALLLAQNLGCLVVGLVLGVIARALGFVSIEMFFTFRGAMPACSCTGLVFVCVLFNLSQLVVGSAFGCAGLTLLSMVVVFLGFVRALTENPRHWFLPRGDDEIE